MSWIEVPKENKNAKLRLVCCHHSGGAASAFYHWRNLLPDEVELLTVQLPGRDTRFSEPLLTNMQSVIDGLVIDFLRFIEKPFILFGHSLGALIVFELTKRLQQDSLALPKHLIVSACRAPHLPLRRDPIRKLPDKDFISKLSQYNGMPMEIFKDHPSLMEIFLPIIRADFTISETYQYSETLPLHCTISAFSGEEDTSVFQSEIKEWAQHTRVDFQHFTFPGDHFYIKSSPSSVVEAIKNIINKLQ